MWCLLISFHIVVSACRPTVRTFPWPKYWELIELLFSITGYLLAAHFVVCNTWIFMLWEGNAFRWLYKHQQEMAATQTECRSSWSLCMDTQTDTHTHTHCCATLPCCIMTSHGFVTDLLTVSPNMGDGLERLWLGKTHDAAVGWNRWHVPYRREQTHAYKHTHARLSEWPNSSKQII